MFIHGDLLNYVDESGIDGFFIKNLIKCVEYKFYVQSLVSEEIHFENAPSARAFSLLQWFSLQKIVIFARDI